MAKPPDTLVRYDQDIVAWATEVFQDGWLPN